MDVDGYYAFWMDPKPSLVLQSICLPILLIFIGPIYQLSKAANPMMLIFSKSIGMVIYLFVGIFEGFFAIFSFHARWFFYILCLTNVPYFAIRLHLLALAFNRFFAVFFPLKYAKINKRGIVLKICFALWMAAAILTLPSIYINLNEIRSFPWNLFLRLNVEQICVYSALLFYFLMAAKLMWMKYHSAPGEIALEKDYCKFTIICIVSICPFVFSILALILMKKAIALGIYQKNHLLQDILVTLSVPFTQMSNLSEEICLLILSKEFRNHVKTSQIFRFFRKALTFGRRFNAKTTTIAPKINANEGANNLGVSTIYTATNVFLSNE